MIASTMSKNKNSKYGFIFAILSVIFWIGVWLVAAVWIDNQLLLPAPQTVLLRLLELLQSKEFYKITLSTLLRILKGLVWGILVGTTTSSLASASRFFYSLFLPLISVTKATPVASFIILVWSFTGGEILPVFVSAIMVVPVVHSNLLGGFGAISKDLRETARIFGLDFKTRLRVLYLPSVIPYFISALTSALGLAWKAGVAAEVLAYTKNSIGHEIYRAKSMLEMPDLFAWTLTVVVISIIIEYAVKQLFKLLPRGYKNETNQK